MYYVPGTVPSSYTHYLIAYYYYPNFTNEETKAERGEVTRPRSHICQWQDYDPKLAPESMFRATILHYFLLALEDLSSK